jgi:hypothetical protein
MAMENPFSDPLKFKFTNKISKLIPLSNHVIVTDMNFGQRKLSSGVILLGDDGKTDGIRPRWCKVYAIGPEQKDVAVGDWILVEHGRWTRGVEVDINGEELTLRRVDPDCIMGVSDEPPNADDNISTSVHAQQKQREYYGD